MLIILLNVLWLITSVFMILVVLIQRGRGGGLAGAFGGAGGSSAFGTRAGDVMTKITVGVFVVWITLCLSLILLMTRKPLYAGGSEVGKNSGAPTAGDGSVNPLGKADSPAIDPPAPIEKVAAPVEVKKEAVKKAETPKAEPTKEAPKTETKSAVPTETPKAAETKTQPAPKSAEPATKKQN